MGFLANQNVGSEPKNLGTNPSDGTKNVQKDMYKNEIESQQRRYHKEPCRAQYC